MELFCVSAYSMEHNRILNGKRYFCSYCSIWLHLVEHWERKQSLLCIICKSLIDIHAIKKQPCVCLSSGKIKGLSKSAFFFIFYHHLNVFQIFDFNVVCVWGFY